MEAPGLNLPASGDMRFRWPPKLIFVFLLARSHTTEQQPQMPCGMDHGSVLPIQFGELVLRSGLRDTNLGIIDWEPPTVIKFRESGRHRPHSIGTLLE
jgi:hypothetical protein